ncbi:MAG: phenylalanine--tRNA ligase subunit beta [Dongiaceae bacterium]
MKFTLSWLKEYLDTNADLKMIAEKLTAIGLEVESVEDPAARLNDFTVAYVESANQHPNADRLRVCMVNTGKEIVQVVCGAPNARAGIKAVFAAPGVVIPRDQTALKKATIRGVESVGMLCAVDELLLGEKTDGIIELPGDSKVGGKASEALGLNDPVIEINLTPNRGDCAGVYGIARDLAAAGLGTLKALPKNSVKTAIKDEIKINLTSKHCPYFAARLIKGVKNGPSPEWMQARLKAIGLRPISVLVDITNYFTHAFARPLHVFDAGKIKGAVQVREAKNGEEFLALNEKTYSLSPPMTVIADDTGVISLAGIMGGEKEGCGPSTTDVILEAALWDPVNIAETGRKLEILSDARYRFERGVDPNSVDWAMETAAQMIIDLCGGQAGPVSAAGKNPQVKKEMTLRLSKLQSLGGVNLSISDAAKILTALHFAKVKEGKDFITVQIPSFRPDIEGEADLIEEILRIHGFDKVPAISLPPLSAVAEPAFSALQSRRNMARRILAARGMDEAVTFSFLKEDVAQLFGGPVIKLKNPISADLSAMRPSILANLLLAAKNNAARGNATISLFEVGPQYSGINDKDQMMVAAGLRLKSEDKTWRKNANSIDAFTAKEDVETLIAELGLNSGQIKAGALGYYHPGMSATFSLGPNVIAEWGEIHPKILKAFDYKGAAVGFTVYLDRLPLPKENKNKGALILSAFPIVERDFAFIVDENTEAAALLKAVAGVDKKLIRGIQIFDVYQGKGVEKGKKSLAFSVKLQADDRTLNDAEIEAIAKQIIAAVKAATGGNLRA